MMNWSITRVNKQRQRLSLHHVCNIWSFTGRNQTTDWQIPAEKSTFLVHSEMVAAGSLVSIADGCEDVCCGCRKRRDSSTRPPWGLSSLSSFVHLAHLSRTIQCKFNLRAITRNRRHLCCGDEGVCCSTSLYRHAGAGRKRQESCGCFYCLFTQRPFNAV